MALNSFSLKEKKKRRKKENMVEVILM